MPDKFTAIWTSHTSISDFLVCPRAYFLEHIYRNPKTRHKIKIMTRALALGQAVHDVLESLSQLPSNKRFREPLHEKLEKVSTKVSGKNGGFWDKAEIEYKERAKEMLRRVYNHSGPLERLAVKIQKDLPYFWLSEEENIILCGKIDWLEYLPETDSVHIIDFKTGKSHEDPNSLQLPIYHLLVKNCQNREVSKASYWYLSQSDILTEMKLPDYNEAYKKVLEIGKKIKLARQLEKFKCPKEEGCYACRPFEKIINGKAEFVGMDEYNYDVYILGEDSENDLEQSIIL